MLLDRIAGGVAAPLRDERERARYNVHERIAHDCADGLREQKADVRIKARSSLSTERHKERVIASLAKSKK